MSTPTSAPTTSGTDRTAGQRSLWSRFLDAVVVEPSQSRLVPVAEVRRESLLFVEESLADVGLHAVVQQVGSLPGTSDRFRILVAARDRALATQVVGLA